MHILHIVGRTVAFIAATSLIWVALPYILALLAGIACACAGYVAATSGYDWLASKVSPATRASFATIKERIHG